MRFDFPTLITGLVIVTGVIWLLDVLVFAPRRRAMAISAEGSSGVKDGAKSSVDGGSAPVEPAPSMIVEYGRAFFPVFAIVFVLRSFIVEPFQIPSGSMLPTLQVGDFLLVNKYSYGLRLPVLDKKIIDTGSPERGDVVVFRYPKDNKTPYIKRIVGLPGDRIEYRDKTLFVNGEPQAQTEIGRYSDAPPSAMSKRTAMKLTEQLGEVEHEILIESRGPTFNIDVVVPDGKYYALGDNRDNSQDSRYWNFVSDEHLIGKAFVIWMHWDRARGFDGLNFSRVGNGID